MKNTENSFWCLVRANCYLLVLLLLALFSHFIAQFTAELNF